MGAYMVQTIPKYILRTELNVRGLFLKEMPIV